jgi:hypothetical protein
MSRTLGHFCGLPRESEQGICKGGTGKIDSRSGNAVVPSPFPLYVGFLEDCVANLDCDAVEGALGNFAN